MRTRTRRASTILAAVHHRICQSFDILKATSVRLAFCIHNLIGTYFLYDDIKDYWCLLNLCGTIFLLIELVVTIIERQGQEPKWFSPSYLIFILTSIPSLWLLEMRRVAKRRLASSAYTNSSSTADFDRLILRIGDDVFDPGATPSENSVLMRTVRVYSHLRSLNLDTKIMGLELSLLLLIVVGRWILPKGVTTSRSNLSQLLLVNMSLASDIVDLLTIFNEEQVLPSQRMLLATLIVLSWSLLQFAINMISTNKTRPSNGNSFRNLLRKRGPRMFIFYPMQRLFENDAWYLYEVNLMGCSLIQLALRLVAVIKFGVRSYSTLFFTCKNSIILFLQFYRLVAILTEKDQYDDGPLYQTATISSSSDERNSTSRIMNKNAKIKNNLINSFDTKLLIHEEDNSLTT